MYLASETMQGRSSAEEWWIGELEPVYSYLHSRVGNRADAEDLTQQVVIKAWPRLRRGASPGEVRAYLFATARSVLATFWAKSFQLPTAPLPEEAVDERRGYAPEISGVAAAWLEETLSTLPAQYRRLLELRFLRQYSMREVATELGKSVGAVKVMQLRALRAAAAKGPRRPESVLAMKAGFQAT